MQRSRHFDALAAICLAATLFPEPTTAQDVPRVPSFPQNEGLVFALENNVVPMNIPLPGVREAGVDWSELLTSTAVVGAYLEPGPDLCNPSKKGFRDFRLYMLDAGPESSLVTNQAQERAKLTILGDFIELRPGPTFCDDKGLVESRSADGELAMEFDTTIHITPRTFMVGYDGAKGSGHLTGGGARHSLMPFQIGRAAAPREGFGAGLGAQTQSQKELLKRLGIDLDALMESESVPRQVRDMIDSTMAGDAVFNATLADRESPLVTAGPVTLVYFDVRVMDPLDLDIYRLGITEEPMTDAEEEELGAQTWVNLDNDDRNDVWDSDPQKRVVGGDDELLELRLRLTPQDGESEGTAKLSAQGDGGQYVRVWRSREKADELLLPASLNVAEFKRQGPSLVQRLWVEGIAPHRQQRATRLQLEYDKVPGQSDTVALTVLGVDKLEWQGRSNGFTQDAISHDSMELDVESGRPFGNDGPASRRVFPGARAPAWDQARDQVDLRVELTVAPVEDVVLYLRSLDIDDPTDESPKPGGNCPSDLFVDPNDVRGAGTYSGTGISFTEEEDNRGQVDGKYRAGYLDGQDQMVAELVFSKSTTTAKIGFRVSLHPGDNYQVAASNDRDFLEALRNLDREDGYHIVDGSMNVQDVSAREIREPRHYASDVLTVWRLLHVERDSMGPVPETGAQKNHVDGDIKGIKRTATGADIVYRLELDTDLTFTGADPSPNLPGKKGRFENGQIKIGDFSVVIQPLDGNGPNYVEHKGEIDIPFILSGPAGPPLKEIRGNVTTLTATQFQLAIQGPDAPLEPYAGGILTIAGVQMEIERAASPNQVTVRKVKLPFKLWDDDEPKKEEPEYYSVLEKAFAQAYVLPVDDGGGNLANNTRDVEFVLNADIHLPQEVWEKKKDRGSAHNERDAFWVAYLCDAYQPNTWLPKSKPKEDNLGDDDPDSEKIITGVTGPSSRVHDEVLARGGDGSLIFFETIRDAYCKHNEATVPVTVAHETGHQFGLGHGEKLSEPVGLMYVHGGEDFCPRAINLIRSRVKSPGE